jgi:hypothetical protein
MTEKKKNTEEDYQKAVDAVNERLKGFDAFYNSRLKEIPLYVLDINALAEKVGTEMGEVTQRGKTIPRKFFITKDESALIEIIESAETDFIAMEAALKIFDDHCEAGVPIPKPLYKLIRSLVNGEIRKPKRPQVLNEEYTNMVVVALFREGLKHFSTIRPSEHGAKNVAEIVATALNGKANSPEAVYKRYKKTTDLKKRKTT